MRKNITMLMVTVLFVLLLTYQPPGVGNAQNYTKPEETNVALFKETSALLDSLHLMGDKIVIVDTLVSQVKKKLLEVQEQQEEAIKQRESINYLLQ